MVIPDASSAKPGRRGGHRREMARYVGGNSLIHRLDSRTKLLMVIIVTACAIMYADPLPTLAVAAGLSLLAMLSSRLHHWARTIWQYWFVVALIIIGDAVFPRVSYGPVLWAADFWLLHPEVTPGGMIYALTMGLRFTIILGVSVLFIMTTRFEDLVAGLRKLGIPYTMAISIGLSMRSLTLLTNDMRAITDAQRSRGLDLESGNIKLKIEHLLSLTVPVAVCLIHRSDNVSSAMMCRGYGASKKPTMYRNPHFHLTDVTVMILLVALTIAVLYLGQNRF